MFDKSSSGHFLPNFSILNRRKRSLNRHISENLAFQGSKTRKKSSCKATSKSTSRIRSLPIEGQNRPIIITQPKMSTATDLTCVSMEIILRHKLQKLWTKTTAHLDGGQAQLCSIPGKATRYLLRSQIFYRTSTIVRNNFSAMSGNTRWLMICRMNSWARRLAISTASMSRIKKRN